LAFGQIGEKIKAKTALHMYYFNYYIYHALIAFRNLFLIY